MMRTSTGSPSWATMVNSTVARSSVEFTACVASPSARSSHRLRKLMTARFQLVRALLDLLFQAGIGFLQLAGHGVELIGEGFEFVPGLDGDALAEVAATEARRTCPQCLDGADHAAGEKHSGEHGETERAQEHEGEPLQGRIER